MVKRLYLMALSPPCRAVQMCARYLGIDLEIKEVNLLLGEQLTPEYLAMNLQHTVPTLDDEGFYLNESRAMLQYLADTYGKDDTLFPKDLKKRALVNQKLDFDMGTLYQSIKNAYYPIFQQKKKPDPADLEKLDSALGFMDAYLAKTRYVASDNFTIADFSVMASLSTAVAFGHSLDKVPLVKAYFEKCKNEIKDYQETCGEGAAIFGGFVAGALKEIQ